MPDTARWSEPEAGARHSGVSRASDRLIGALIDGRYRVEALLGEGGMGLVYRATHIRLQKTLAIKVLRRENVRDPEVIARFRREAESASNIGNEHIVDISDFGSLPDGSAYFVMECLEGRDLVDELDRSERLSEERAVHIARQICVALGAAHEVGIVHRDLKPENVFLVERGDDRDFVKVLDFGIAKVANRPHRITRDGEVLGTPHYMAPEQCSGGEIDRRADVYALGALLYEMVTGHVPHDADTVMGILTKQMYADATPPRTRTPALSPALEQLILRALAKKPEERYPSMHEMERALAELASHSSRRGTRVTTMSPMPVRLPRKPRALWSVVAGALTLVAIGLGTHFITGQSTESELDAAPSARSGAQLDPLGPAPEADLDANPSTPAPPAAIAATGSSGAPEAKPTRRATIRPAQARRARTRQRRSTRSEPGAILDPWE